MIGVEEARKILKNLDLKCTKTQKIPLEDGLGFTLAKEIFCSFNLPPFEQSIMDGFAVNESPKTPLTFEIIDEIQAGSTRSVKLKEGQAAHIYTGAPVPDGTKAIVMQEHATIVNKKLIIQKSPKPRQYIRAIGSDLKKGQLLFHAGSEMNASSIGVLKSTGVTNIEVYTKPIVNIVVTGDELVTEERPLKKGEIYESNAIVLKSVLEKNNIEVNKIVYVKDNFESTLDVLSQSLKTANLTLVSGGISVGAYDYVYESLKQLKVKTFFYKVRQKPGKPLFFGGRDKRYIFALPGNPGSALTCLYIYTLPFLKRMQKNSVFELPSIQLELLDDVHNKSGRALFLKGKRKNLQVRILEHQSSSKLMGFALADVLVFIPEYVIDLAVGSSVKCYMIH